MALRIHRLSRRGNEPFLKVVCTTQTPWPWGDVACQRAGGDARKAQRWDRSSSTRSVISIKSASRNCSTFCRTAMAAGRHRLGARVISSTGRNLEQEIPPGAFQPGTLLPPEGCLPSASAAAGLQGRHPSVNGTLPVQARTAIWTAQARLQSQDAGQTHGLFLARECSSTGKRREEYRGFRRREVGVGRVRGPWFRLPARRESFEISSLKQAARAAARQAERELILKALDRTHWNRKRAAKSSK